MKTLFSYDLTLEEAEELIKNGADVNEIDMYGATPLFQVSNIDIARLLIQNNANVNHLLTSSGETPLFYANNIDIAEFFIKNGALLNIRNTYGNSVLDTYYLISKPFTPRKYIKCLIQHGLLFGKIENYQKYRDLFNSEQQKAFDSFLLLTNNDEDFFQMCLAYQENIKNNVKMDIKDMGLYENII